MNKPRILIAFAGAALVAVIAYQSMRSSSPKTADITLRATSLPSVTPAPSQTPASNAQPNSSPAPTITPTTAQASPGKYVDYSSSSIASTTGTKIIFFHAPWCPQCRALEANIKAGDIPSGVTIFKLDYDSNQALRQKYGVTIQTTLVKVADDGSLVKKYVAYEEPSLASLKKNLLP